MSRLFALLLAVGVFLMTAVPIWADTTPTGAPSNSGSSSQTGVVDVSGGIQPVSTEQAVAKAQRVFDNIYELVLGVAPKATLAIVAIGAIFAFAFHKARVAIFWAIVGMIIILWAPKLVGHIIYLIHV